MHKADTKRMSTRIKSARMNAELHEWMQHENHRTSTDHIKLKNEIRRLQDRGREKIKLLKIILLEI